MSQLPLKPCPFCGGQPKLMHCGAGTYMIQCLGCKTTTDDGGETRVVGNWNRRCSETLPVQDNGKLTPEEAWTHLCETPDVTSPEEYPDHALITFEQLCDYMHNALPPVVTREKAAASASKFKATASASEHHKDGSAGVLPLQAGNCTHESGAWLSTMEAPKDGSMLRLLVIPHEASFTGFDDDLDPYETIGFNNLSNTGEDRWEFVGWDWSHDQFITGHGEVVGWQQFTSSSEGGDA